MSSIYLLWQDQHTAQWHTVARLTRDNDSYRFNYTQGATTTKHFAPFPTMEDLNTVYESDTLLPFFQNRILSPRRPEFDSMISWLGMTAESFDPLEYLGVSGGQRQTDNYRIFKTPELGKNKFTFNFLVSGIYALDQDSKQTINQLSKNAQLEYFLEADSIGLRDKRSGQLVGYCPGHLVNGFKQLIESAGSVSFTVKKVNVDALTSCRLLCTFQTKQGEHYKPLITGEYLAHTAVH